MPEEVKYSTCKLFADDCKLYGNVDSTDRNKLQQDLIDLERWSELWQLPFNSSKCKVMHFGQQKPRYQYYLNDEMLDETDCEKDLGVIIDDKLKFHAHAAAAKERANQILGLIKKSYNTRDSQTITILHKTMVRPLTATSYGVHIINRISRH